VAARAIWKGVVKLGKATVPVKLYSAVTDKSIHFRLLHKTDHAPVKQQMVNPETDEPVEFAETKKAFPITRSALVILENEELEKIIPEASRDIEVSRFVKPSDIDHRWYERAYYLGPDNSTEAYFALAQALEKKEKEGVAQWVMRGKNYIGALRADDGYLMLIVLRHADEVIDAEELKPPEGRALDKREVAMAEQLVDALSGEFDPNDFKDTYRQRVMELIETKSKGKKPKVAKFKPKPSKDDSLDKVLAASLAGIGKKRAAGGR
jgi:DNA end-binding protein Ku